jgi:hypothetical protein
MRAVEWRREIVKKMEGLQERAKAVREDGEQYKARAEASAVALLKAREEMQSLLDMDAADSNEEDF